jgi:hypothetical protein
MPIGAFKLNSIAKALSGGGGASYISASGGTVSYFQSGSNYYKVHSFTTTGSNNFVVSTGGTGVDAEIVGGGGGSGSNSSSGSSSGSGGGGGGQRTTLTNQTVTAQTYTITVGAGGTGGTSGATGGTGGSSTALGTTVVGGGGSPGSATVTTTAAGAAGGGGGSFYPGGVVKSRGTGTLAGGTATNGGTGSTQSSGGGGSNLLAGTNGSGGTGGNGGTATASTFTGSTVYLGGGGNGVGQTSGTPAQGVGVANSGAGAPGVYSTSAATTGTAGSAGVVNIRYLYDPTKLEFLTYVTATSTGATTITMPTIQANDIVFFFTGAVNLNTTIPTAIAPSGWTSIINTSLSTTNSGRHQAFYKVMAGTESGTTLSTLVGGGVNQSSLVVYRPNVAVTTITTSTPVSQSTTAAPTAQSLVLSGQTGPYIGFAFATGYSSAGTPNTTSTPTRTVMSGSVGLKTLEFKKGEVGVNQTVTMSDAGTFNALSSIRVNFS